MLYVTFFVGHSLLFPGYWNGMGCIREQGHDIQAERSPAELEKRWKPEDVMNLSREPEEQLLAVVNKNAEVL